MRTQRLRIVLVGLQLTILLCFGIAGRAADDSSSRFGTISGVVWFTGEIPPAKKITITDGGTIEHSDLVVDAKTKGLRFVMAVLEDAPAQPMVEQSKPVVVDQGT